MKSRHSLVSNSSTSSYIINALLYSGVVTTPILLTTMIYQKTSVKNFFKSLKNKIVVENPVKKSV